jgi:gamma-aminobutyric acid type B receptor
MSVATIPLGFDDQSDKYMAYEGQPFCMAYVWLLVLGFTIVFSALFAKTWRINQVLQAAGQMQKITVTKRDVALPFALVLTCNVATLTVWTLLDPRKYVRFDEDGTDEWNRVMATHGMCQSAGSDLPYLTVLILINFGLLLSANYQAWRARNVKSMFSEAQYIAGAVAVGAQAFLMGVPSLALSGGTPQTLYLTRVFIIFIVCMAVATLIFVPKIISARDFAALNPAEQNRRVNDAVRQSSV